MSKPVAWKLFGAKGRGLRHFEEGALHWLRLAPGLLGDSPRRAFNVHVCGGQRLGRLGAFGVA
jgi:hypothetical protein